MTLAQFIKVNWGYDQAKVIEQYHVWGNRVVYRIATDREDVILKGVPSTIDEACVMKNAKAHEFLGNHHGLSPSLIKLLDHSLYTKFREKYYYLMTYVDGRQLEETVEDEYLLGKAASQLHQLTSYSERSDLYHKDKITKFLSWFEEYSFKSEYDQLLNSLPDFSTCEQCFIHTDIGPHNAKFSNDEKVTFVDLDDAGYGPKFLDLGWPFIMQFVDYNKASGEMSYRHDLAIAYLLGYFDHTPIEENVYNRIWEGAVYMHVSYMKNYGDEAVIPLWNILQFGLVQKQKLFRSYHESLDNSYN